MEEKCRAEMLYVCVWVLREMMMGQACSAEDLQ